MAETVFRGPAISYGACLDGRVEPSDGPDMEYQASAFPDPRYNGLNIGATWGRIPGYLNNPYVVMSDNVPQATAANVIATNQHTTNGTGMTLQTASVGGSAAGTCSIATNVPLIPFQSASTSLVTVMALDFGFATGTTTTGGTAATVTVLDSTVFYVGQWIVIGGAGNSTNTIPLITQVQTLASATTITISPVALGALSNAPISDANLYGSTYLPDLTGTGAPPVPTATNPYSWAGITSLLNPLEAVTRNVTITSATGAVGGNVVVAGYDIYGVLMHETIVAATTSATVAGKKAFKYISSVTPAFTDTGHNYSVGIGNLAGFNLRTDKWEYTNIFFGGSFATTSNGWTAWTTAAAGDVRGTINVANGTGFNSSFSGTSRIAIMQSIPLWNILNATPLNAVPLFGPAQT